ncbi:AAA family ATPase [Mitsuaria sp. GD03876]|uniref:AAA family ATPase n=1 Tax=Mitsuaria sp. GD03876 TaxID=2975399 RepID=UPI00244AB0B3|nr:AAA family ATPase [Mitsuaria sp. GD03876]MDH0863177.1 AAA family ATPase [Mitsuaria sp. GD03876]
MAFQPSAQLINWLCEQFTAHEFAKLEQGGHTSARIRLRHVFVDLPVSISEIESLANERIPLLHRLISSEAATPPKRMSVEGRATTFAEYHPRQYLKHSTSFSWTLLVGGPGQGKSTLCQLAAQLYRAELLRPYASVLPLHQQETLSSFSQDLNCADNRFSPAEKLFPIHISLPDLATWLLKRESVLSEGANLPSLLAFILDQAAARSTSLAYSDLTAAIGHLPVFLVLDGFDEVGAKRDRQRIVDASREFIHWCSLTQTRIKVVATTRPQGYTGELSHIGVPLLECRLSSLVKEEALDYANKLVKAKISGADAQSAMFNRLQDAANEPSTERLMTTPLQVTILAALVQQLGRAPRERWNLFYRYFLYTYDREVERGTYASALLAQHRIHIERIHSRVALLLQVGAERDGGGSARMPRKQLEQVVRAVLEEDEIRDDAIDELQRDIALAAEQRLVFLVEPEPNQFGFEIRSLQEFMAAWALTSGRDSVVLQRLSKIAPASMFRNVTHFASSRLFSEGSELRDLFIEQICPSLESGGTELARISHQSALLALETLEEGSVQNQPRHARALMEQASALLQVAQPDEISRIIKVVNADTLPVLERIVRAEVQKPSSAGYLAAWAVTLTLSDRGDRWAIDIRDSHWNDQILHGASSPRLLRSVPFGDWLCAKLEEQSILPSSFIHSTSYSASDSWAGWLTRIRHRRLTSKRRSRTDFEFLVDHSADEQLRPPQYEPPSAWLPWTEAAKFWYSPTAEQLARALRALADCSSDYWWTATFNSGWPLSSLVRSEIDAAEVAKYAVAAEKGDLGDTELWLASQERWEQEFTLRDLVNADAVKPWDKDTIQTSLPILVMNAWSISRLGERTSRSDLYQALVSAARYYEEIQQPAIKTQLAAVCCTAIGQLPKSMLSVFGSQIPEWLINGAEATPIIPRPAFLGKRDWYKVVEALAEDSFYYDLEEVSNALREVPAAKRHLFKRQAALSLSYASADSLAPELIKFCQAQIDTLVSAERPTTAEDAVLQVFMGSLRSEDSTLAVKLVLDRGEYELTSSFLNALRLLQLPKSQMISMVTWMYREQERRTGLPTPTINLIRQIYQTNASDLSNPIVWSELQLPRPHPVGLDISCGLAQLPHLPVNLERIQISDVGGIRSLVLEPKPADEGKGQWIVILGANGAGKTTLLKSIAIALRNSKDPGIWPKNAFSDGIRPHIGELGSDGNSKIEIGLSGVTFETILSKRSGESLRVQQQPAMDRPQAVPLFAYGCRRGSALGGIARDVDLSLNDGPEIATLFDPSAYLIHAETWLIKLEGDAQKNPRSRIIYDVATGALAKLLEVSQISVRDQTLIAHFDSGRSVPFKYLSDGYLASAGWFLDLIARWLQLFQDHEQLDAEFMDRIRGLVLIDEIDLHLHPKWQTEVIDRTRRILPSLSFIVTTHNPLTLVGARPEEVFILRNDEGACSVQTNLDSPATLSGAQIYQQYFDIEDIFPSRVGRQLKRFEYLSGFNGRSDSEELELNVLIQELKSSGAYPDWEIVGRDTLDGADQ